jgi:hypothetical protein
LQVLLIQIAKREKIENNVKGFLTCFAQIQHIRLPFIVTRGLSVGNLQCGHTNLFLKFITSFLIGKMWMSLSPPLIISTDESHTRTLPYFLTLYIYYTINWQVWQVLGTATHGSDFGWPARQQINIQLMC